MKITDKIDEYPKNNIFIKKISIIDGYEITKEELLKYVKNKINRLEIYDLLGKKLLEKEELDILRIRLPMSNPGIYIVKLFSESGVENHRIIKK